MKRREKLARVEAVVDDAKAVLYDDVDHRIRDGLISREIVLVMRGHLHQLDIALGREPEPEGWPYAVPTVRAEAT